MHDPPSTSLHRSNPQRRVVRSTIALLAAAVTWLSMPPSCQSPQTAASEDTGNGDAPTASRGTPVDQATAHATFDAVWTRVYDHHFDPEFNGVDWVAIRETYAPRIAEVETQRELRIVLSEMLGELGQSHFGLIPSDAYALAESEPANPSTTSDAAGAATGSKAAPSVRPSDESESLQASDAPDGREPSTAPGWSGLVVRFHDGSALVTTVERDSPAATAGVRPGDVIETVDGRSPDRIAALMETDPDSPMLRYEANAMMNARLAPPIGTSYELGLRSPDGATRTVALTGSAAPGRMVGMGNLPPMQATLEHRMLDANALSELGLEPCGGDLVSVVGFSVWLPAISQPFDEAIDASRDSLGVVIDLRGNPGGLGAMAMGFGGHFADQPVSLGTMSTRDTSLHFRVNPRRVDRAGRPVQPLDVPVAILVDEMSASTSEIFAGGMQEAGLARVFGRRTPGAALPATATDLPNGDVLLAAMADFTTPKGVRLEGRGVVPDEPIELDPATLAAGDPDLRAAAAWILDQYLMPDDVPDDGPTS